MWAFYILKMNLQVALKNYNLVRNLDMDQVSRFYATDDGALWIDNRWFQSVRRTYTGESRNDLLEPIRQTWRVLIDRTLDTSVDDAKAPGINDIEYTLATLEGYIKRLYGIDEYNGVFNGVFREIRLAIVDAKRELKDRTKVIVEESTSQEFIHDKAPSQGSEIIRSSQGAGTICSTQGCGTQDDSTSEGSIRSICPPIHPAKSIRLGSGQRFSLNAEIVSPPAPVDIYSRKKKTSHQTTKTPSSKAPKKKISRKRKRREN